MDLACIIVEISSIFRILLYYNSMINVIQHVKENNSIRANLMMNGLFLRAGLNFLFSSLISDQIIEIIMEAKKIFVFNQNHIRSIFQKHIITFFLLIIYNLKQIMDQPEQQEPNPVVASESTGQKEEIAEEKSNQISEKQTPVVNTNQEQQKEVKQLQQKMDQLKVNEEKQHVEEDKEEVSEHEEKSAKQSQNQLLDDTKYFVEITKQNIVFGKNILFPGSIQEIDVSIGLKDDSLPDSEGNDPYMLRVIAKCSNPQFDALDEYVFSVRSNDRFQYFEEVRFKIRKKQRANVKVAVKIPPVKENYTINGILEVQLEGLKPVHLPITSKCEIPQILCMKDLFKIDQGCSMIKVPAKKNQIRMPPIPFKNLSNFNFALEIEAISTENFGNRAYDIVSQNFVNCQANMQFFVNLQLKQNINYKGVMPVKDTIRKILILKIRNSSIYFNYPLEVNVYEGSNANGMS